VLSERRRRKSNEISWDKLSTLSPGGRALDRIATAVGLSRHTLAKIKAVSEAARQNPERYQRSWRRWTAPEKSIAWRNSSAA